MAGAAAGVLVDELDELELLELSDEPDELEVDADAAAAGSLAVFLPRLSVR